MMCVRLDSVFVASWTFVVFQRSQQMFPEDKNWHCDANRSHSIPYVGDSQTRQQSGPTKADGWKQREGVCFWKAKETKNFALCFRVRKVNSAFWLFKKAAQGWLCFVPRLNASNELLKWCPLQSRLHVTRPLWAILVLTLWIPVV